MSLYNNPIYKRILKEELAIAKQQLNEVQKIKWTLRDIKSSDLSKMRKIGIYDASNILRKSNKPKKLRDLTIQDFLQFAYDKFKEQNILEYKYFNSNFIIFVGPDYKSQNPKMSIDYFVVKRDESLGFEDLYTKKRRLATVNGANVYELEDWFKFIKELAPFSSGDNAISPKDLDNTEKVKAYKKIQKNAKKGIPRGVQNPGVEYTEKPITPTIIVQPKEDETKVKPKETEPKVDPTVDPQLDKDDVDDGAVTIVKQKKAIEKIKADAKKEIENTSNANKKQDIVIKTKVKEKEIIDIKKPQTKGNVKNSYFYFTKNSENLQSGHMGPTGKFIATTSKLESLEVATKKKSNGLIYPEDTYVHIFNGRDGDIQIGVNSPLTRQPGNSTPPGENIVNIKPFTWGTLTIKKQLLQQGLLYDRNSIRDPNYVPMKDQLQYRKGREKYGKKIYISAKVTDSWRYGAAINLTQKRIQSV